MNYHISKNFVWLLGANIIKSLYQWALLVILIKNFSEDEVGIYSLGLAIAAPYFVFSDMQLKNILIVDRHDSNFVNYLLIRCTSSLLTLFLLILFYYNAVGFPVLLCVFLYKVVESCADIFSGFFQKRSKFVLLSKLSIVKCLVIVLFFVASILFKNFHFSLFSLVFISLICFFTLDYLSFCKLLPNFRIRSEINIGNIFGILKNSIPIGISAFFSSYITNYPKIVVDAVLGTSDIAHFSAFSYIAIGLFQIQLPIQLILRKKLVTLFDENKLVEFNRVLFKVCIFLLFFCIVLFLIFVFVGDKLVLLFYTKEYLATSDLIYYMLISQFLMSIASLFSIALLSFRVFRLQIFISLSVLIFVFLSSEKIINTYGVYGAGYISIVSSILNLIFYFGTFVYVSKVKRNNTI